MKTETLTAVPFPPVKAGDYLTGWEHTYKIIEITSATTATVRRVYWWERLYFWLDWQWFHLKLDVAAIWRRLKRSPGDGRSTS